jgi:hypothetical protein
VYSFQRNMIKNAYQSPLISGRHQNIAKSHIISEFTSLCESLCFPAPCKINVRATLEGELFSGETSELGS